MFIEASLNLHVLYQHLKWNFYIQGLSKLLVHYSYMKLFLSMSFKVIMTGHGLLKRFGDIFLKSENFSKLYYHCLCVRLVWGVLLVFSSVFF